MIAALETHLSVTPGESRIGRPHATFQPHHDVRFTSRGARIIPRRIECGRELLCVEHETQFVHGCNTERQRLNAWSRTAYLKSPFTVMPYLYVGESARRHGNEEGTVILRLISDRLIGVVVMKWLAPQLLLDAADTDLHRQQEYWSQPNHEKKLHTPLLSARRRSA
jgi:hypothetical protein